VAVISRKGKVIFQTLLRPERRGHRAKVSLSLPAFSAAWLSANADKWRYDFGEKNLLDQV
jgi:hypothetical protein